MPYRWDGNLVLVIYSWSALGFKTVDQQRGLDKLQEPPLPLRHAPSFPKQPAELYFSNKCLDETSVRRRRLCLHSKPCSPFISFIIHKYLTVSVSIQTICFPLFFLHKYLPTTRPLDYTPVSPSVYVFPSEICHRLCLHSNHISHFFCSLHKYLSATRRSTICCVSFCISSTLSRVSDLAD